MDIINGTSNIKKKYKKPVVAIGVFDGFHIGHQHVIQKTISRAKAINGTSVVFTFSPHPVHVLRPEVFSPLIIPLPYRLRLIEEAGIDVCVVIKFTKKFASLSPEQFIEKHLMRKIRPYEIIVGTDFLFGKDREGTLDYFKKYADSHEFNVSSVSIGRHGKKTISSTRIRQLITEGEISKAAKLLGRPVSVLGKVVHGDARGETLGYPTANIMPSREVIPPSGVYIVNTIFKGKRYKGIACVGRRPSFKRLSKINIEVHIFNFNKNLYNKEILVEFLKKIRDEKVFLSKEELVSQIKKDESKAIDWFKRNKVYK